MANINMNIYNFFLVALTFIVSSCAKQTIPLHVDTKSWPYYTFIGFGTSGHLPDNISSGTYTANIAGSAIDNCEVYLDANKISKPGIMGVKIGSYKDTGDVIINCTKGKGINGKKYNLEYSILIKNTKYSANTQTLFKRYTEKEYIKKYEKLESSSTQHYVSK